MNISAPTPENWPFDQAPNVAAITSKQVLAGATITHVYHFDDDDSWVFLHDVGISNDDGQVIGMGTALKIDSSLRGIADLPTGWMATRTGLDSPWIRSLDS